MSFYKEVPDRQTTLESTLKFDTGPKAGSTNPVTSDGVKSAIDGAVGDAAENLQEQIDEIAEKAGSGYIPKGEATVATLNALSGQENGELYTMTDAGTLTDGSLAVVAGDTVAWDATNEVWYKAMDYAPRQYGTNEVHNLQTSITAFRTGDVIPVDGPSGTAKMSKDDLLRVTAENALGSIHSLSHTATEAGLVAGNYIALDGDNGTKKLPANLVAKLSDTQKRSLVIGYVGIRDAKPNIYYYNGNIRYVCPLGYIVGENTRKYISAKNLSFALTDGIYGIYFEIEDSTIHIAEPSLSYWTGHYWFLGVIVIFDSQIENLQMFGNYQLNGVDQHYDPTSVESSYKSEDSKITEIAVPAYSLSFSSVNFTNVTQLNTNGTLGRDGTITEQGGSDCVYSDFLPLDGKQYNYFGGVYRTQANFAYYSEANESSFISSVTGTEISTRNNGRTYNGVIPRVLGAKYIRIAWNTAYEGYASYIHSMLSLDEVIRNNAHTNRFYGKKAAFLGDSITIGSWNSPDGWVNMDKPYPYWVGQILGMSILNYGIGGTHLSGAYTSTDGSNPSQSFTNRYSSMDDDADLIVVMGGTNDWLPSHIGTSPMGSIDDETDISFYGGLNVLCKGLLEKYIGKDVVFMTPISNANQEQPNPTTNCKLVQYAKAIKEVCAKYSIPVIDCNAESPMHFYVYDARLPYSNDGTHPNPTGQHILGEFVARRLLGL